MSKFYSFQVRDDELAKKLDSLTVVILFEHSKKQLADESLICSPVNVQPGMVTW